MVEVIEGYETLSHYDRIRDIVERLAQLNYSSHLGIIERRMGIPSISNRIDYYHKDDIERFKIFASYCAIVEYSFLKQTITLKQII